VVKDSEKDSIVKTLALDLGLGGKYSEELCMRSGIDKNKKDIDEKELKVLFSEIQKLRKEKISPGIILKDGKRIDISPINMKSFADYDIEKYKTFSEALGKVLTERVQDVQKERHEEKLTRETRRIKKIISEQEETIKRLKKSIKENKRKGELTFERYSEVNEVLTELNKAKEKYSWKEIKKKLKGHKTIKEINEKEKKVVVEL